MPIPGTLFRGFKQTGANILTLFTKQTISKTSKLMLLLLAFSVDRGNDELTNTTLICSLFYQYKR